MNELSRPHRARWLVLWIVASLVLASGAYVVGTRVRSPYEEAAGNSQQIIPVTASVSERTVTSEESVVTGTASLGVTREVSSAAEGRTIVTAVSVSAGDVLEAGTSPVEVNSRPLIALALPFDLFRDLTPGLEGSDVSAVQTSLQQLGLYRGGVDGVFGAQTSAAVRSLYTRAGAHPPTAPTEAIDALDAAKSALAAAQSERSAASAQPNAGTTSDLASLDRAVADAQAALSAAQVAADTPLPSAEVLSLQAGSATVVEVAAVGMDVSEGSVLTIRSGAATVTARASVSVADQLVSGASATVSDATDTQTSVSATVISVSEFRAGSTEDGAPPGYDVTLALTESPFPNGALVVVTPTEAAASTTGPAVPVTAVRQDQQGEYVERASDGARVSVEVLATGGGWAVVESTLEIGDVVQVSN